MEFTKALIKGKLIKRYKRFFTDIKLDKGINPLQLILGNHMHVPHQPPLISKKIKVIVK